MTERLDDFYKKYNNTYIRYIHPITSAKFVGFVDTINLDEQTISLNCDELGLVMLKYPQCLANVDLETPSSGLFNHNEHALYLFKSPVRQWHRGMCASNHEIYNPFRKLFFEGVYRPTFGRAVVNAIFSERYFTDVAEAVQLINSKSTLKSLAITRNLMLSKSPSEARPLIWFKTIPVGYVKQAFIIEDQLYQQEVHDELQRIGQEHWIS